MFVSLSLPRVEGADLRPWVPPEHSLVISSVHDAPPQQSAEDGASKGNTAGSASLLTLEWEAAAQMARQKLQVLFGFLCWPCIVGRHEGESLRTCPV